MKNKLINFEHVSQHTPRAATKQVYKLATMLDEQLHDAYDLFLYRKGHQVGKTAATAIRYKNGYLYSSKGYENGVGEEFNEFVAQL